MHRVVEAVADLHDVEASAVDSQLFDTVDPDALDALFETLSASRRRDDGFVQFPYGDAIVRVYASGRLEVSPADAFDRPSE